MRHFKQSEFELALRIMAKDQNLDMLPLTFELTGEIVTTNINDELISKLSQDQISALQDIV